MTQIPFVNLKAQYQNLKPEIDAAIQAVIEETAFIGGQRIKDFETAFGALLGTPHVVACANGTDSLYIIMKALGIGAGDEVITVANSWISSSETIGQTGALPVFVDIESDTLTMDVNTLEAKITPQTKAVIAVHLHGQMAPIERIKALCDQHNLYLIEDCAQAHLSASEGKYAGTFGHAASFSFYPGKNLGAYGDAGCIITDNERLANACRMFANHGALKKHEHQVEGINSRLDGLQAAVLNVKLPHLKTWTAQRQYNAKLYRTYLSGIDQIQLTTERANTEHSYHLFIVLAQDRDALKAHLAAQGIETAIHYPRPLPLLPAYAKRGYTPADFPNAKKASQQMLSLPMYAELTEKEIKTIAEAIRQFYQN